MTARGGCHSEALELPCEGRPVHHFSQTVMGRNLLRAKILGLAKTPSKRNLSYRRHSTLSHINLDAFAP